MGTESLPTATTVAAGLLIKAADFLTTNAALQGALVPRNTSGVPTSGQSLGTALYPWGNLYADALTINGSTIDVSEVTVPSTRIISGATRTTSGQPQFLQGDAAAAAVDILATTTDLVLSINSTTITVSADITETGLTTAPSSNNTCAINDARFTDQDESKYFGEIDSLIPYITIDAVGSEISALVGQFIALKTDTNEIMFGWLKNTTELVNVYRGFFFDPDLDPIVRETLIDDEVLTLMKLGWVFLDDDGATVDVTYTTPVDAYTAPSAPAADDYWYDRTAATWKRYSGAAWVAVDRIPLGLVVMNTSYCIATRSFDFYGGYSELNTLDCEVFSDTVVRSGAGTNMVNVYGEKLTFEKYPVSWDNTANMSSGTTVANDTDYYLYLSTLGDPVIDLERPYDRTADLRGRYHPYNNWRYIAKAKTDGAADWIGVTASSMFDREPGQAKFESDNLKFDASDSDSVLISFDKLVLTNAEGKTKTLYDMNQTVTFSKHLQGGELSELSTNYYECWIDSLGKISFLPRLTGTATGTSAGFLVDTGNAFPDYSVYRGSILYNTTDNTQTTLAASPTASGDNVALTSDIMASGETYDVKLINPVGLDSFACHIGSVYNNSSGNLDDSKKNGRARITTSFWHTVNGYGSSSTKIQKFTTEVDASDDVVVTVANSATLGFTVTANMDCKIDIGYSVIYNAQGEFGISKNSTELTTGVATITASDRMTITSTDSANWTESISWSGVLKKGDVIRTHTSGAADGAVPARGSVTVVATEII